MPEPDVLRSIDGENGNYRPYAVWGGTVVEDLAIWELGRNAPNRWYKVTTLGGTQIRNFPGTLLRLSRCLKVQSQRIGEMCCSARRPSRRSCQAGSYSRKWRNQTEKTGLAPAQRWHVRGGDRELLWFFRPMDSIDSAICCKLGLCWAVYGSEQMPILPKYPLVGRKILRQPCRARRPPSRLEGLLILGVPAATCFERIGVMPSLSFGFLL